MNKRKRIALAVIAISLAMTVLVVVLLSGSGNGYEKTFDAIRKLVFETDNFTVQLRMENSIDGKYIDRSNTMLLKDGNDNASWAIAEDGTISDEDYTIDNKTYHSFDHEKKTYYFYVSSADLYDAHYEDNAETLYKLTKLMADFFSGNVKNQFSHSRMENGDRYTVSLNESQLPEAATLLLELINTASSEVYLSEIEYEDFDATFRAYYKDKTGSDLAENFFDVYYNNEELRDAFSLMRDDMYKKYTEMLTPYGDDGYVYVYTDGTADAFASGVDFYKSLEFTSENIEKFGTTPFMKSMQLKNASAQIDIDESGRFTNIRAKLDLEITDFAGNKRTNTFDLEAVFSDYGTTSISLPDMTGYVFSKDIQKEKVLVTQEIEFNGAAYPVEYTKMVEK